MEHWQVVGNQVIASELKSGKSVTAEIKKYRQDEMEEQIMERKERIKKLEDQFSEMRDCVENLVAEAKQDEARISKIEKKLIDKVKKIRKISAIAIIEGLINI
jgi:predicted  nucleic acid-binding Zn-ribbon protein